MGKRSEAKRFEKELIDQLWDDSFALDTITRNRIPIANDSSKIQEFIVLARRSIELESRHSNHHTCAVLCLKLANYMETLEQANLALTTAKNVASEKQSRDLIKIIKEKIASDKE